MGCKSFTYWTASTTGHPNRNGNGSLKTVLSPWAGLPWEPHRGRQSM